MGLSTFLSAPGFSCPFLFFSCSGFIICSEIDRGFGDSDGGGLALIQMGVAIDGGFCCVCGLREKWIAGALGVDVGLTEANARGIEPGLAPPT
jgi:hypothetical protein